MLTSLTFDERVRGVVERFSLRNLTIAVGIAALLAGIAAVVSVSAPEKYESTAVLVIDNPLALAAAGDDGTVNKLDRLRGKYAALADTTVIAGPVAEQLGVTPDEIIGSTEVTASPSTLGLIVAAEAGTAEVAMARAAAMADGLVDYVSAEHETYEVPAENRFFFEVVQPADTAAKTSPSSERAREAAAIAFVVALVAVYVVLQMLRVPAVLPDLRERDGTTG
jgi:capsular polysaccharide biosynthesis protein